MVCIDDFAIKKRETYGTIMIDINTHRIVDMVYSREQADVVKWLKSYPNISVFSRDGSITYHKAISESHPSAVKVSDRFHLLKNLTGYAIEYLKKQMKTNIPIEVEKPENTIIKKLLSKSNENRKLTLPEKYEIIKKLLSKGKIQTQICQEVNMDVRTYKNIIAMSDNEREQHISSVAQSKHEAKLSQKIESVNEVRELRKIGYSNRKISKQTGFSRATVRKYIDENFNPVHARFGTKIKGLLTPFINEIDNYLDQGIIGSIY